MAEDGGAAFAWASLVPEVYFDLIARVPAGATILFALLAYVEKSKTPATLKIKGLSHALASGDFGQVVVLSLLLIGSSYLLGLLVTLPSGVLQLPARGVFWLIFFFLPKVVMGRTWYPDLSTTVKHLGLWSAEKVTFLALLRIELESHEYLSASNPEARSLLAKMRAEVELCFNLSVSLAVLAAFEHSLGNWFLPILSDTQCFYLLSSAAIYTWCVGWYRIWRLLDRQFVLLQIMRLTDTNLSELKRLETALRWH